ncbi:WhiB family transcriptional regulator [Streptomyces sp. NPDC056661]|uniref:WhiB family transcriptional regulator n=1 Tax=Streptomyces sp. NPDC056661 TaxID=3345898 RepID=UPI003695696A
MANDNHNLDPITGRRLPRYLNGLPSITDWHQDAACAGLDMGLFFPTHRGHAAIALAICGSCPVIRRCRDHAEQLPESFGIWGGTTAGGRGWSHAGKRRRVDEKVPPGARTG